MDDVFCMNCQHYVFLGEFPIISEKAIEILYKRSESCGAPENQDLMTTYLKEVKIPKRSPAEINKFNDCSWFKPKK